MSDSNLAPFETALLVGLAMQASQQQVLAQQQRHFEWNNCISACLAAGANMLQAQAYANTYFAELDRQAALRWAAAHGYRGWWWTGAILAGLGLLGLTNPPDGAGLGFILVACGALILHAVYRGRTRFREQILESWRIDVTGDGLTTPLHTRVVATPAARSGGTWVAEPAAPRASRAVVPRSSSLDIAGSHRRSQTKR